MKNRHLAALGIAALVMIALAFVAVNSDSGQNKRNFVRGSYLLQGFNPDKVFEIRLKKEDGSLSFKRENSDFGIVDKFGYPASIEKINGIFRMVLGIECDALITSEKENYSSLGVEPGGEGLVIGFFDGNGKKIVGVVAGNQKRNGAGSYVRLEDGDDVYLSKDRIELLSCDYMDYINPGIFPDQNDEYAGARVMGESGYYEIIAKDGKAVFGDARGRKEQDDESAGKILDEIAGLEIKNIYEKSQADEISLGTSVKLYGKNGITYTMLLGEAGGKYLMTVEAGVGFPVGDIEISMDESCESLKKKESILISRDAAAAFNGRHAGWLYEIDEGAAKTIKDLLADFADKESAAGSQKGGENDNQKVAGK